LTKAAADGVVFGRTLHGFTLLSAVISAERIGRKANKNPQKPGSWGFRKTPYLSLLVSRRRIL
jgi:hypothetical protein